MRVLELQDASTTADMRGQDKRAAHYNEFQRVKELRKKMARGEVDDEDE